MVKKGSTRLRRRPSSLLGLLALLAVVVSFLGACLDSTPEPRTLPDGGADLRASDDGSKGADLGLDAPPLTDLRLPLAPARSLVEGRFATSLQCATCHENVTGLQAMRDAQDRPIAPFDLWRATAMANAARDPLWRAAVAVEVEAMPEHKATIEATCLRCHSPMAHREAALNKEAPPTMSLLTQDTARSQLALDGVSCSLCHQIEAQDLGTAASYSAGFSVSESKAIYGPHDNLFGSPMISGSGGFEPRQGAQIRSSGLCGSCHTLFTNSYDAQHALTGRSFPEQTPYLEWRNSTFNTEGTPGAQATSCQGCHLPLTSEDGQAISTQVASDKGGADYSDLVVPQRDYGRHLFIGGNTLLPTWLKTFRDELAPNADVAAFDALIARVRRQLSERTAGLRIEGATRQGDRLELNVVIDNKTGHKLPTGYPARRLILQLVVRDGAGQTLFSSGRLDSAGRLLRSDGTLQPFERAGGPQAQHHVVLSSSDDVQVYETVLADSDGRATYHLLRADSYAKDNRLLPIGWSASHPDAATTSPVGANGDTDFVAGGDTVRYQIDLPAGTAAGLQVEATLRYQALAPRHGAELLQSNAPEVQVLRRMLAQSGYLAELVAQATQEIP